MNWINTARRQLYRSRWGDTYEHALQRETKNGYLVIDRCDEELWYIIICHDSIEEFQKNRWAVLRFYKAGRGYVCRAKLFYKNENIVCIGDIESKRGNKGYGSKVLRSLIKICQQLKVQAITGEISGVDSDHLDKLEHFYEKHGFKLTMYKKGEGRGMIGKVERRLSDHSDS